MKRRTAHGGSKGPGRSRRRPGESWSLWRVHLKNKGAVGYLVSDRQHCPQPIAFVAGVDRRALQTALHIDGGGRMPRRRSVLNLRGVDLTKAGLPPFLYAGVLIPVSRSGRRIARGTFAAGQYVRSDQYVFHLLTHGGLENLVGADDPLARKRPQAARPIVFKLASTKSDEARAVAAA